MINFLILLDAYSKELTMLICNFSRLALQQSVKTPFCQFVDRGEVW
ncbi:hypothetical protein IQ244_30125 [Nostoc sp. LEGE 06077]|nr:hypothetical protein [Nostoc sp. LEGE 06077]